MAEGKNLRRYLSQYKKKADEHLKDESQFVYKYYTFFQGFFQKDLMNISWQDVKDLCNHIHSFNALALAKSRATKEIKDKNGQLQPANHSIEHYRKVFYYLKNGNEDIYDLPVDEQHKIIFNNLLGFKNDEEQYDGNYKLAYFGTSSISEIIGNVYADRYVFYNRRDIEALIMLGFEDEIKELQKEKKFGDRFIKYNKFLSKKVKPEFRKVFDYEFIKEKELPENILIDQFFNWVYKNKVFTEKQLEEKYNKSPKGKISKIIIKNYNQLQNLHLNLTYPDGHEKAGKPLDKVCLIGQSGTGKTTILDLIFALTANEETTIHLNRRHEVEIHHIWANDEGNLEFVTKLANKEITTKIEKSKGLEGNENTAIQIDAVIPRLMYLPSDTVRQINIFNEAIKENIELGDDTTDIEILDLRNEKIKQALWDRVSKKVADYRKEEVKWNIDISRAFQKGNIARATQISEDFQNWKAANSPFAELNSTLQKDFLDEFNIKIIDDAESADDMKFIQFTSSSETFSKTIPIYQLSTGTKQILIKTLPFWALRDKDESVIRPFKTIILIDEPENSLYPNKQKLIIQHFQETLTTKDNDCQFFYATHSPILLGSFEPWEIIVLENQNGIIKQRKLYNGERHLDNYFDYPTYLRWDDILIKYLGLEEGEEGGDDRYNALNELSNLEGQINALNGNDLDKKKALFKKYKNLADKLGWTGMEQHIH